MSDHYIAVLSFLSNACYDLYTLQREKQMRGDLTPSMYAVYCRLSAYWPSLRAMDDHTANRWCDRLLKSLWDLLQG